MFSLLPLLYCVAFAVLGCAELREAVHTHLTYNFTLAAVNTTHKNANRTGSPLVLGQNGATSGAEFEVTSTYASYPYDDFPYLNLRDTSLRAFSLASAKWSTNATVVISGEPLGWVTSSFGGGSGHAAKGFTAVSCEGEKYPVLAFEGMTDLWYLCPFDGYRGQTNVVFNVSDDITSSSYLGFDPRKCYPVRLNIVRSWSCLD